MNRREFDTLKTTINLLHHDKDYEYLMGVLMDYYFDNKKRV